ncbi:hypothetical protein M8542_48385 [Amycolatopsis sp. OK19-0408]|uniref:Uncharacterized protein n=1 Tax=Amycolatopsis iheyensis TaxID=2945988 RepID=A0A9X2SQ36_9PSEU|nr:hypothetical protein [Amycolatopsis iheyensis]MCR6490644.1 hypothetical protein [Amycolatopsis iheyensis]
MSRRRARFGRIDPWCLLAAVPLVCVAALLIALAQPVAGVVVLVPAALVPVFDAWANRPSPAPPRPRPVRRRQPGCVPGRAPARPRPVPVTRYPPRR